MPSVQMDGLDKILADWDALQREFPTMKREVLKELSLQMLSNVQ